MADGDNSTPQAPDPVAIGQAIGQNQQPPDLGQPSTPMPTLAPQRGSMLPGIGGLLANIIKPPMVASGPGQIARPASRAGEFESFLGQFLYSMGQGFANEGRGPGAFGRGFGAAATAPVQLGMQQQQLQSQIGLQQAQAQEAQQRAALTQAQSQPINIPGVGNIPAGSVGGYFGMQGKLGSAQIAANASLQKSQLESQTKLMTTAMMNPSLPLDPTLAAAAGHPEWANQPIGKAQLSALTGEINTKTKLVGTARTGEQIREDADGNMYKIPVTSTSRPNLPIGGATPTAPARPPINQPSAVVPSGSTSGNGNIPKPKTTTPGPAGPTIIPNFRGKNSTQMMSGTDADGSIVAGTPQELTAAGITNFNKMDANDASKVTVSRQLTAPNGLFSLVNQDLQKLGASNLGPIASRWNDYMSGKVGTGPDFAALRTHMGLLGTALMQAHMGSKGGEGAMEHFQNLADYRISDAATLRSALAAEYRYVTEKAARPKQRAQ